MDRPLINPLLTDFYQITMAYAYWQSGKKDAEGVFDLFFRKCPFHGEFTIFAGLEDCLEFIEKFQFKPCDIEYLRETMSEGTDPQFFDYLSSLTTKDIKIYALKEGSLAFPRVPLLRVEGPLPVVQLLETTLLNLINFASLVATNSARFRLAAGPDKALLEFGLRRAQGPDGGLTASRYCYIGGFDASSNVLAGKLYGVPIAGTHAHAFVNAYEAMSELKTTKLAHADDASKCCEDFPTLVLQEFERLQAAWPESPQHCHLEKNEKELAAFTAYALAFPRAALNLIDTYDVVRSGCPNFIAVAMALSKLGYIARGVRLDSGDLAYQSIVCRELFVFELPELATTKIVASNDINEDTLYSLKAQGNEINSYGVGTHLVTCQAQPALGCVYKIVQINNKPCIKLSAEVQKVTMPGRKECFRLYGRDKAPICDLLVRATEKEPESGAAVLCRHPFQEQKRAYVRPTRVERLHTCVWDGARTCPKRSLEDIKAFVGEQMASLRMDHKRQLNPTPYKVSVSEDLYTFIHDMWLKNAPVGELS